MPGVIIKLKMSYLDWSSNDGNVTSLSSFVLGLAEKLLVKVRGFLFQFGMVWEQWLRELVF